MIQYDVLARGQLKSLRAKMAIVKEDVAQKRSRIAAVESLVDEAADRHQKMTAPIQEKLKAIEDQSIARIVAREPADDATEQLRVNLLAELENENAALERARNDTEARLKPLRAELDEIMRDYPNGNIIENQLYRTGDKAKLVEHEGMKLVVEQMNAMTQALRKKRDEVAHEVAANIKKGVAYQPEVKLWKSRLPRWEVALQHAGALTSTIAKKADAMRREIIEG